MDVYVYAENVREAHKFIEAYSAAYSALNFIYVKDNRVLADAPERFSVLFVGHCARRESLYVDLWVMVLKNAVVFDIKSYEHKGRVIDLSFDSRVLCRM